MSVIIATRHMSLARLVLIKKKKNKSDRLISFGSTSVFGIFNLSFTWSTPIGMISLLFGSSSGCHVSRSPKSQNRVKGQNEMRGRGQKTNLKATGKPITMFCGQDECMLTSSVCFPFFFLLLSSPVFPLPSILLSPSPRRA